MRWAALCVWTAVTWCWAVTPHVEGSKVSPVPAYLVQLYRQMAEGGGGGAAPGTAVHALMPVEGLVEGATMQVFNISSIHSQEVLRQAQLHVHRRLLPGRGRSGSLRLRVCHIAPDRVAVLEDIVLSLNSTGWQVFDVSEPVRLLIGSASGPAHQPGSAAGSAAGPAHHPGSAAGPAHQPGSAAGPAHHPGPSSSPAHQPGSAAGPAHLLGLRVEVKRPAMDDFRPVPWRRMRKLQPFIVAFTDDEFSMEEDIEHNYLRVPNVKSLASVASVAPPGGDPFALTSTGDVGKHNLLRVPSVAPHGSDPHGGDPLALTSTGEIATTSNRLRRSVEDNKLPASEGEYYKYKVDGSEGRHVSVFSHHSDATTEADTDLSEENDASLIPYPPKHKHKKWRRRKHKKRKQRRRKLLRNRQLPVKWNYAKSNATDERPPEGISPEASLGASPEASPGASPGASNAASPGASNAATQASQSSCQRHRLTIDFDAIGWGEWIINPQRFDAFYCAGTCAFPLSKDSRPTNHATIQSLAAMLGLRTDGGSGVPAPCCVPDAMDSLTLLYFDETRQNVVLKNYPKMVVKSCSCR